MTKQKFNSLGLKVPVVEGEAQKGEAQGGNEVFKVMQKYTFHDMFGKLIFPSYFSLLGCQRKSERKK